MENLMKTVYLDTCSIQRPLDDKSQVRVAIEAEAVIMLVSLCEPNAFQLVSSDALVFEQERNPNSRRREFSQQILQLAKIFIESNNSVLNRAEEWQKNGLSLLDAIHFASAIEANADYFCTTDVKLYRQIKKSLCVKPKVVLPLELLEELI